MGTDPIFLIWNGRLYVSMYGYYDAGNKQQLSHFNRPLTLSTTGDVRGPFGLYSDVPPPLGARMYSGWMAILPMSFRALLGGGVVVGQCCVNDGLGERPLRLTVEFFRHGQAFLLDYEDDHGW